MAIPRAEPWVAGHSFCWEPPSWWRVAERARSRTDPSTGAEERRHSIGVTIGESNGVGHLLGAVRPWCGSTVVRFDGGAERLGYRAAVARPRTPKGRARVVHRLLAEEYPDATCELDHRSAFELLVATILSAQCTDARVNMVTPVLFDRWPDAESLSLADPSEVEKVVHSTGFYAAKTRSLLSMSRRLVESFDGEVPSSVADLTSLAGVGRKTANVVRSVALGLPGLPVDTHVLRLSGLLGLTTETDPVKVERDLNPMVPAAERGDFSLRLILHGRRVCVARRPRCSECALVQVCPSRRL